MMAARSSRLLPVGAMPIALYLVVILVVPVSVMGLYSFWTASFFTVSRELTFANYVRIADQALYLPLILRSLGIGLLVAAIAVPLSYLIAFAVTFRFPRWGRAILILVMLSMLSSYLVRIYAWKTILGPQGAINQLLMALGLIDQPLAFLLYGDFALVVTLVHILLPYAVLPVYSAMQNIDRHVLEASRDLGATAAGSFWRVLLPLSMPGVITAFVFCFILAAADYVTPQLVGGKSGMLVGRVIADQYGLAGNPPFGAALSVGLMLGFVAVLLILALLRRPVAILFHRALTLAGRARRPRRRRQRRGWLVEAGTIALMVFLYAPLLIVLIFSFNSAPSGIFPIQGLTLRWYEELLASEVFGRSLRTSLALAAITVVGTLLIATPAAFALVRRRFLAKPVLLALILGPIAVPGVVIGVSLISAVAVAGAQPGLTITALAHILFTLPFVVLVVRARLLDFDRQIEEAARDLGARPLRVLQTVTLPLIAPSLVGAAILVFALSIDEFIITNFVIGANSTLPVMIWSQMRTGITPSVNAMSTVILLTTLGLIAVAGAVLWRRRASGSRAAGLIAAGA
jgi:ABC-type spermidine/putrescine transport system permease subunit I